MELVRQIEERDLPEIAGLLEKVFGDPTYANLERLGGMTNRSYHVTRKDGGEYLVRIPGEGSEELLNRDDERKSTELACKLGIDSELLYFDSIGHKVMRFISHPQPIDEDVLKKDEYLNQAADIFHKLHTCGEDTGVRFEVFEMADDYENVINNHHVALYDDYAKVRQEVMDIKAFVDKDGQVKRVPCHNDSLVGNWVIEDTGRLYLVDWEYSGMNEPMWDLSCFSIECDYSEADDMKLLHRYFGREVTDDEHKRFIAAKTYVDYLWTLWGLTRVPYDGQFMQEYADGRYARLKKNIAAFKAI